MQNTAYNLIYFWVSFMQHSETDREDLGKSTAPREIIYLSFAAIPVLIYVLAMVVFEEGDFGSLALISKLEDIVQLSQHPPPPGVVFSEARARITWLSTVLLYYVLTLGVIVICVDALKRSLTSKGFKQALLLWGALSCVALGHLYYAECNDTALRAVFHFTYDSLAKSEYFTSKPIRLAHIKTMVTIVNVLAAIAPFVVALSASATLTPIVDDDPAGHLRRLAGRVNRLKTIVTAGSALLVAGVLHMQAWLNWPITFVADPKLVDAMTTWALSLTTFVGTIFSLMLASVYIPCVMVLTKRAENDLRTLPPDAIGSSVEEWLDKQGFSSAPLKQIPQILAVLAPLFAGSVGTTLTGLGS